MLIAELVSNFITLLDQLELGSKTMDELYPYLKDLNDNLNSLSLLPPDFEGRLKISKWLANLSEKEASHEITDNEVIQMKFDLKSSYDAFNKVLSQS